MPSSVTRPAARPARSYGKGAAPVQTIARLTALAAAGALLLLAASPSRLPAADPPVKIVALGDSLTAGYGLGPADAFPVRLERALKAKGLAVDTIDLAPFRALADKVYAESDLAKAWDAAKLKQVLDTK